MIGQTIAIFVDAYRDLNARKLFWITLILSAFIVIAFGLLGVDATGLKLITFHIDMADPLEVYNGIFQRLVIGMWLTWAATILALVSTAGMFPDFVGGGCIDLYLAKPIGRARLFLTKYVAGLLFVTMQVLLISAGSYFVMGLRGHEWKPKLFLAVPIVVCFFSYLFAICVLIGVKTRSAIAALLLTILCWAMLAGLDYAEPGLLVFKNVYEAQAAEQRQQADFDAAELVRAEKDPNAAPMVPVFRANAENARREAESNEKSANWLRLVHRTAYVIKTVTPKTTDTIGYLNSSVFKVTGETTSTREREVQMRRRAGTDAATMAGAGKAVKEVDARSPAWIIGTSLAFEAAAVSLAMWIFCRRDY